MRVSVVVTVLNEAESLPRLLDSLAAQTHAPDEVVICDGGSTDGTLDLLEAETGACRCVVLQRPGANISQGRNAAIEAASGDVHRRDRRGGAAEPRLAGEASWRRSRDAGAQGA